MLVELFYHIDEFCKIFEKNLSKKLMLEDKVKQEGIILTESQIVALERKKYDDEASAEIETMHP